MGYSPFHLELDLKTKILRKLGLKWTFAPSKKTHLEDTSEKKPAQLTPSSFIKQLPTKARNKLLQQRRPSYSLWLYKEYFLDLVDKGKKERKELILKIIKHLKWPTATIAFWPLFWLLQEEFVCHFDFFEYGFNKIKPTYIFCFGEECFKKLFPQESFVYEKSIEYKDSLLITLPDFKELFPDNRALKKVVWKTLNRYAPQT